MKKLQRGQLLIELVLTIGLAALILPGLVSGLLASRDGKPQQEQRLQAIALMKETETAVKSVRDSDWATLSGLTIGSPYHPVIVSNRWSLSSGSASTSAGFTQQVILSSVYRTSAGAIASTSAGNTLDPSTRKADITVSWTRPIPSSITSTIFLTRTSNLTASHTTKAQFDAGTGVNIQVTNDSGGEVKLANNNKAKWCTPAFALNDLGGEATIDLPDGPPVAVAATASATTAQPNDVFVATAPYATSSAKLAYVNVTANTDTPATTLRGKFTMNASEYASGYAPQSGTGLDNNFSTTDVKYYKSSGGNTYAILGTNLPDKEVIVVWVNDGNSANDNTTSGEYQDPVNKLYKYKTFFNTRRYNGIASSSNDQSPYSYGASSVAVLGDRGYVASGGYLYVFNLANIDSKSTSNGLDMYGCRIELDGYECRPGSPGTAAKYDSGQSGTSWGDTTSPIHNDCSDGGNIELLATNDIFPVKVGNNTYVYVAVGGVTNPEFEIVNVTTAPTSGSSLTGNSCGRISGGATAWKVSGSKDFNTGSGTEEASNSVFSNADGSRAYISSNGGSDSKQFYILNTTSKTSPTFLTGSSTPSSGFYNGASPAPSGASELYPRRSLTVLNGQRAVLVGKDGISGGGNAQEYQVLNTETEATPTYCSGVDFNQGFNDLTSVSEADYDNYVYMVANTTANELKIIQGGPDNAIFMPSGTFESQVFDTASVEPSTILRAFNRLLANIIQPTNTSVKIQVGLKGLSNGSCPTSGYTYIGPDGSDTSYYTPVTTVISDKIPFGSFMSGAFVNPERCFRYKVTLESLTDQTVTPVLQDITWNYSQ